MAFSPDGKTLATAGDDGTARLWNLATGQQIRSLTIGSVPVISVAFSPDGKTLAGRRGSCGTLATSSMCLRDCARRWEVP